MQKLGVFDLSAPAYMGLRKQQVSAHMHAHVDKYKHKLSGHAPQLQRRPQQPPGPSPAQLQAQQMHQAMDAQTAGNASQHEVQRQQIRATKSERQRGRDGRFQKAPILKPKPEARSASDGQEAQREA
jgi:hypothetical protein